MMSKDKFIKELEKLRFVINPMCTNGYMYSKDGIAISFDENIIFALNYSTVDCKSLLPISFKAMIKYLKNVKSE